MNIDERIEKLERLIEDPTINGHEIPADLYRMGFLVSLETNLVYCLREIKKLWEEMGGKRSND